MMQMTQPFLKFLGIAFLVAFVGCDDAPVQEAVEELALDADYGKPLLPEAELAPKDDSLQGKLGPDTSADSGPMVVWDVTNQWEDVDTEAARAAGLAWEANSGLDWNDKYALWIESMEKMDGYANGGDLLVHNAVWTSIAGSYLECAETAISCERRLRPGIICRSTWRHGPLKGLFFSGISGFDTPTAAIGTCRDFRDRYADYSDWTPEEYGAEWPTDPLACEALPDAEEGRQELLPRGGYVYGGLPGPGVPEQACGTFYDVSPDLSRVHPSCIVDQHLQFDCGSGSRG